MPTPPNLSGSSLHFTAGSALDILLVFFLIYQFLLLVRGTRAVPMLTGVGALVIAFYIAHLTNLRTLDWLVGTILPYSIFALIVIFQTEIRQALSRLGRNITRSRATQSEASDVYDDVVMAANTFSQDQTGALIVIEREIGLRTYIESGVALTPISPTSCWQPCSVPAPRCTTARSFCRATAWPPPPASCRFP